MSLESLEMETCRLIWLIILVIISCMSSFSALTAKDLDIIWIWISIFCDLICFFYFNGINV